MARRLARIWGPLFVVAALVHLSAPRAVRAFLYHQFYPIQRADQRTLHASPELLKNIGYVEDPVDDLSAFSTFATQASAGADSDGQRLSHITRRLYALRRPGRPTVPGGRDAGIYAIFDRLQQGDSGLCGHMTLVLAAMWRSLGGDFREVRFAPAPHQEWAAGHYALEVYSPATHDWMYFDATANTYAVDDDGRALSLADINHRLLAGKNVTLVTGDGEYPWTTEELLTYLRSVPADAESVALDNRLLMFERDRRFGRLNFAWNAITQLPRPMDRFFDAITTGRTPRLVATDAKAVR